jgi:hypothetical protein
MEGAPPVANQNDLFMHFLGASRDGLVARPVEMDKLSSSVIRWTIHNFMIFEGLFKKYKSTRTLLRKQ